MVLTTGGKAGSRFKQKFKMQKTDSYLDEKDDLGLGRSEGFQKLNNIGPKQEIEKPVNPMLSQMNGMDLSSIMGKPMQNPMMNQMQNPMMNQMRSPMMNQMQNPMMNQMQNPMINQMQNPMMNQMQNPMMNQMRPITQNNSNEDTKNNDLNKIDSDDMLSNMIKHDNNKSIRHVSRKINAEMEDEKDVNENK